MTHELRSHPREQLSLRVVLADRNTAVTRNLSIGGVYVVVPSGCCVENWVSFEFDMPEAGFKYVSTGQVVRVEQCSEGTGIALKMNEAQLVSSS